MEQIRELRSRLLILRDKLTELSRRT